MNDVVCVADLKFPFLAEVVVIYRMVGTGSARTDSVVHGSLC